MKEIFRQSFPSNVEVEIHKNDSEITISVVENFKKGDMITYFEYGNQYYRGCLQYVGKIKSIRKNSCDSYLVRFEFLISAGNFFTHDDEEYKLTEIRLASSKDISLFNEKLAQNGYNFNYSTNSFEQKVKIGEWVIYWDTLKTLAKVGILTKIIDGNIPYIIDNITQWKNAISWDGTKDHLIKIRNS